MNRKRCVVVLASSVAACGAHALPPAPPPEPPVASATGATSPAASAEQPPANAGDADAAPAPSSPFYVLGELPSELTLYPAGDRAFLVSQRGVELVIAGDEVSVAPLLQRGLPSPPELFSVEGIAGRWPDALWLSTGHPAGRSGFSKLWSWNGKQWVKRQQTDESRFVFGMEPWLGGRMLAVEQAGMMFDASFRILSGDRGVRLPRFTRAKRSADFSFCITRMRVDAFAALQSGEVFVAGQECDAQSDAIDAAVERWDSGAEQGHIDVLPGTRAPGDARQSDWTVTALLALAPNDVYVAAEVQGWKADKSRGPRDYFAHFDGSSWQQLPAPLESGIHRLWSQADGAWWALDREQALWARSPEGRFRRVPLPEKLLAGGKPQVEGFWPRAPGDAWAVVSVAGAKQPTRYLLHTRPGLAPLPTYEAIARKQQQMRLPGPAYDWCETPFVLLYTLGRRAPADYDYPATRAALKGHREFAPATFVEFEREGRRYFGARVPDFKLGKQLAALVKQKVPGSTPQLACHDPLETRQLHIDLATGQAVP